MDGTSIYSLSHETLNPFLISAFIHLNKSYLLSTYYILGIMLDVGEKTVNKTSFTTCEVYILVGGERD